MSDDDYGPCLGFCTLVFTTGQMIFGEKYETCSNKWIMTSVRQAEILSLSLFHYIFTRNATISVLSVEKLNRQKFNSVKKSISMIVSTVTSRISKTVIAKMCQCSVLCGTQKETKRMSFYPCWSSITFLIGISVMKSWLLKVETIN